MEVRSPAPLGASHRALVLELADRALGVDHPLLVRRDPDRALAARPRGEGLPLRVRRRLLARLREHRRLRRDVGGDSGPIGRLPDPLGCEAGVGRDRFELGQGEASAVQERLDGVALKTVGLLAQATTQRRLRSTATWPR